MQLPDERVEEVRSYLNNGAQRTPSPPPVPGGRVLRHLPSFVPEMVRQFATLALRPIARRQFAKASQRRPLLLHLGCGRIYKENWVNVDLFATQADIYWDLKLDIPLGEGSVDAVFHEHMLTYLAPHDAFTLTQECLRVLAPGGILRIGVPDAAACLDSYSGKGSSAWADSRPTRMLAVQALFYDSDRSNRAMYDVETLELMCLAAGFTEVVACGWREGSIQPSPDSERRKDGTLYVEAHKAS